jgi:hypothetical protein
MTDQEVQPTFDRRLAGTFDRVLGTLDGLPDVTSTKPSTVQTVLPFIGNVTTYVVRTFRSREAGFTGFIELVDVEGRARIVLPDKVMQALYRQRQSLTDRSTPESRARKAASKAKAKAKAERAKRKAAWAAKNGRGAAGPVAVTVPAAEQYRAEIADLEID